MLASELDLILMSLASIPIEIPRFSCIINKNDLAQRPEDLAKEQPIVLEPFKPYIFSSLHPKYAYPYV